MERINAFAFYQMGKELKLIEASDDSPSANDAFWAIINCRPRIENLMKGNPIPIGFSTEKARNLHNQLTLIFDRYFSEKDKDGKVLPIFPDKDSKPIEAWQWHWVKQALNEFETVFAEEMREATTYFVPRRGIYSTPALVDSADQTFPQDLLWVIPQKTRDDWNAAGRCLAFNLLTASGFHAVRAVEGTIEAYLQWLTGNPKAMANNWNIYIQEFERITNESPKPKYTPSKRVIAEIEQMKDDYRNPVIHPRVVLTEADARILFANGESLIVAMAQEIAKAKADGSTRLITEAQQN